ncbi:MAG: hypothetical protein BGO05_05380 [Rhizobiales bacterium 63-7]|nr:hypothetical protein [Hyphomicrobiales bacterium]OJU66635.1 MAG: hypothetical protein BGO05_05380 [Rhizobiales bacterium 63-7]
MSGGSLNYVYVQVNDAAQEIQRRAETTLQRAFAAHMMKVATALHDIEWLFSCDTGPGDEVEAIKAVLADDAEIRTAIEEAERVKNDLERLVYEALAAYEVR